MNQSSREFVMDLLATMMLQARAEDEGRSFQDLFAEFRRSKTFEMLYDPLTGLWENGPVYLAAEYDRELAG